MRRAAVIMVLAIALAAAGPAMARSPACGVSFPASVASPWPSMRHDTQNTGLGTIPGTYQGDQPWSFATGAGLFITPVVGGNGLVYFGSADHNFYALNPGGKLCWRLETGNIIDAAAALDSTQRTVTIGSADENLYHLSAAPAARRQSSGATTRRYRRSRDSSWIGGRTTSPTARTGTSTPVTRAA